MIRGIRVHTKTRPAFGRRVECCYYVLPVGILAEREMLVDWDALYELMCHVDYPRGASRRTIYEG